jgi:hypothetical protein
MLGAIIFFAWTSPIAADFAGNGGNINFGTNAVDGPHFFSDASGLDKTLQSVLPSVVTPVPTNGFTLEGGNLTITNSSGGTLGSMSSPIDAGWTATRQFTVTGSVAIKESIDVAITSIIVSAPPNTSVNGSLLISESIYQSTTLKTTHTALNQLLPSSGSIGPLDPPNQAFAAGVILSAGTYFVQLSFDLKLTSIPNGASVSVDDNYGVSVDAVPEPSSLVLFAILSTTMLAGLARRRWQSRRRCGSDQRAAAALCG